MTRQERKQLEWEAVHTARQAVRSGAIKASEVYEYRAAFLAAAVVRAEMAHDLAELEGISA